jgi:hypothetical protein
MKIHIHCSGSLTDGLDSPSRGEGRWTQNLARILAKAGHTIVATGGGNPSWGSTLPVDNVLLVPESASDNHLKSLGPFDLDIDPARWEGKPPRVKATKHLLLKWSLEDYTRSKPLPEDTFLCYPLSIHPEQFFEDRCVNKDKTFFLPLPLGDRQHDPNFDKTSLLWTCKDIDREKLFRDNAELVANKVLRPLLQQSSEISVVWLMMDLLKRSGILAPIRQDRDIQISGLVPYFRIRELLSDCKVVVAANIPGSVLDAAMLGVPTLEWEVGGFFNDVGKKYGVLIERGARAERISKVLNKYINDREFYTNYVKDIQYKLRFNVNDIALSYFDTLVNTIF